MYEAAVNKYGYSLSEPRRHVASTFLKPMLLIDLTDVPFQT